MDELKIPKRISTALLNSLGAGVVPRIGLEYIAVGRKREIETLLNDIGNISEGGASFRIITGRYGSGKSFMLQIIRNYAMERGFAVADADLSPERRLTGTKGQGLATYRELMRQLSTKTRPDGGALPSILERWISGIQAQVMKDCGLKTQDADFDRQVEIRIMEAVNAIEGMVHGFDFASVLITYWEAYRSGNDELKNAALRWLRGEFSTKTEARSMLDVRIIIDDDTWYDYIKLMASFITRTGYKGLLIFIDEAVNLYKITNTVSRQGNYEKLLTMFNDTMQGKVRNLGIIMAGTPQFLEDNRQGLYSYEALRSRLAESRFMRDGYMDIFGPIIRLQVLTNEEIFVLLQRLAAVHAAHFGYEPFATAEQLLEFMKEAVNRLGAQELLTPREIIRDFISLLNILQQNPDMDFMQLLKGKNFSFTDPSGDPETEGTEFAEFTL